MIDIDDIGGQHFYYYSSCKRQFWLYAHGIVGEENFDSMTEGKVIHEESFSRMTFREIPIGSMKIDFIDQRGILHETKSSKKVKHQHRLQVLFYLYYLHEILGLNIKKAIIHYPVIKKQVTIEWTNKEKEDIETVIDNMNQIYDRVIPPEHHPNKKLCQKCSYFYVCYA